MCCCRVRDTGSDSDDPLTVMQVLTVRAKVGSQVSSDLCVGQMFLSPS